jgi:hypothetical protein
MAASVNCFSIWLFTLQRKVVEQIFLGARWLEVREHDCVGGVWLGAIGGVTNDLFEGCEVFEVAFSSGSADAADGLGPIAIVAANYLNHFGFLKNAEVAAEIAVSEGAELLEIVKWEAFRVGDERSQHTQASALVDDAVKTFVCETAFVA